MKRVRVIYGKGLRDYILLIAYGFPPWSIKTLSSTFLTGLGRCTWWTSPSAACLWLHACTLFQLRGKLLGFLLFGKGLLKWCLGFSNPWAKLIEVSHAAVKDGVRRNPRPHSWFMFVIFHQNILDVCFSYCFARTWWALSSSASFERELHPWNEVSQFFATFKPKVASSERTTARGSRTRCSSFSPEACQSGALRLSCMRIDFSTTALWGIKSKSSRG